MPITERSIEIHLAFPLTLIYKWEHLEASVFARHLLKKRKEEKKREKKTTKFLKFAGPSVLSASCTCPGVYMPEQSTEENEEDGLLEDTLREMWLTTEGNREKQASADKLRQGCSGISMIAGICGDLGGRQDPWSTRDVGKGRLSSPTLGCDFPVTAFVPFCCRN